MAESPADVEMFPHAGRAAMAESLHMEPHPVILQGNAERQNPEEQPGQQPLSRFGTMDQAARPIDKDCYADAQTGEVYRMTKKCDNVKINHSMNVVQAYARSISTDAVKKP